MINKILFFTNYPFTQRDYVRFGIDILAQNGFNVEIWDFTPILRSHVIDAVEIFDSINIKHYHQFLYWHDAKLAILKLTPNCFIINLINYNFKSLSIYRALSHTNIPYCVLTALALPSPINKKSFINRLKESTPSEVLNKIFINIPYNLMGILPAATILLGGTASIRSNYPINGQTEFLWVHTLDYDLYLNEFYSTDIDKIDLNMGVFLDQYLPHHPDYITLNKTHPTTPSEYYPKINKFFDTLENKYGVDITIAAHPRSNYDKYPDYFGGRPIIKGSTIELIKKCGFVIAHASTAINFAVLFNKPVIFITTKELQQNIISSYIESMALNLNKKPIYIDDPAKIDSEIDYLSVNEKAYAKYKNSYIKKEGSEDLPFWQIFANYIKKKYGN